MHFEVPSISADADVMRVPLPSDPPEDAAPAAPRRLQGQARPLLPDDQAGEVTVRGVRRRVPLHQHQGRALISRVWTAKVA